MCSADPRSTRARGSRAAAGAGPAPRRSRAPPRPRSRRAGSRCRSRGPAGRARPREPAPAARRARAPPGRGPGSRIRAAISSRVEYPGSSNEPRPASPAPRCWKRRRGCCGCSRCCRRRANGPGGSSVSGSGCRHGPSATTWTSSVARRPPAGTGLARGQRCRRCCSTTRRPSRSARTVATGAIAGIGEASAGCGRSSRPCRTRRRGRWWTRTCSLRELADEVRALARRPRPARGAFASARPPDGPGEI